MAPELLENRPFNKSVDVYAFGILLWEVRSRGRMTASIRFGFVPCDLSNKYSIFLRDYRVLQPMLLLLEKL